MATSQPYAGPDRRLARPSPLLVGLVGLGVAGIAFATLCPIGLRPHLASANAERCAAYLVLGGLAALAAGRRWAVAAAFVVFLAFGLEVGQFLAPGRHPEMSDALVKEMGGVLGALTGQLVFPLRRRFAGASRAPAPGMQLAGAALRR